MVRAQSYSTAILLDNLNLHWCRHLHSWCEFRGC